MDLITIVLLVLVAIFFWFMGLLCGVGSDRDLEVLRTPHNYGDYFHMNELNNKNLLQELSQLRMRLYAEEKRSNYYCDRSRACFSTTEEKSMWLNKDLEAAKKLADEKLEEVRSIIKKI